MRLIQYIEKFKSAKNSLKKQRLYALLFTLTLWLVLSTSAVPSYSQAPTPTLTVPTEKLKKEIQQQAEYDVEGDISRKQTRELVDLYGKETVGIEPKTIKRINEYFYPLFFGFTT